MFGRFSTPLIVGITAGASGWLGHRYERYKTDVESLIIQDQSILGHFFATLQNSNKVFAATPTRGSPSQPMDVDVYKPKMPSNRTSDIMKYGYPSLDNVLAYDGHVLAYDRRNRVPHWVFEQLRADTVKYTKDNDRSQCDFEEDHTIHRFFRSTNDDYKGSGFDRGHLAAAANHRASQNAIGKTFLLSNIAPQVGNGFNRHAWNELERYVRSLTKSFTNVYVCTGPLYLPRRDPNSGKMFVKYQVIGRNQVAVPTHFFKVVVCESSNKELHLLSYVLPNEKLPENVNLNSFLVPLESVQRASGLLIFDKVPNVKIKSINGRNM